MKMLRMLIALWVALAIPVLFSGCGGTEAGNDTPQKDSVVSPEPVVETIATSFAKSLAPHVKTGDPDSVAGLKQIEAQLKKPPKMEGDVATATVAKSDVVARIQSRLNTPNLPRDAREVLEGLKKRLEKADADGFGAVPKDPSKRSKGDEELQMFLAFGAMAMVAINPALAPIAMMMMTMFGGMTEQEARGYVSTAEKIGSNPGSLNEDDWKRAIRALPDEAQSKVDLDKMMDAWRLLKDVKQGDLDKAVDTALVQALDAFGDDEDVRVQLMRVRAYLKLAPDQRNEQAKKLLLEELNRHTPPKKKKLVVKILKFVKLHDLARDFERGEQ